MKTSASSPGKVFVLGEYAVLDGKPAVVASVGPRFKLRIGTKSEAEAPAETPVEPANGFAPHPQSPVSRLIDWAGRAGVPDLDNLSLEFEDPFEGSGGFGSSTAQFALAYRVLSELSEGSWDTDWGTVWRLYRELMASGPGAVPPSGADLIAQWQGGVALFSGAGETATVDDLWDSFDWSSLIVFSATRQPGRKVATHDHLKRIAGSQAGRYTDLEKPLAEGIRAMRERDARGLGKAMDDYAKALSGLGLESDATRKDRLALRAVPGVLGMKGAGAMQADSLLVLIDPSIVGARTMVISLAERRGLDLVCDGLSYQRGVTCCESGQA